MSSAFALQRKPATSHSHDVSARRSGDFSRSGPGLPLFLQKKLAVSRPGDSLEQEADRMADAAVCGGPMPAGVTGSAASVQRKCACAGSGGECDECRQQREEEAVSSPMLQRASTQDAGGGTEAPSVVHETLRSRGEALGDSVRPAMERRFGRDFSNVRIHTSPQASRSAQAVNALAYTAGNDVVFAPGQYSPQGLSGKKLLAHELAHVVQQTGEQSAPLQISRQADTDSPVAQTTPNTDTTEMDANQNCGVQHVVVPSPGTAINYVVLKQGASAAEGLRYVKNVGNCSVFLHGLYPSMPEDTVEVKPGETRSGYVPHKGSTMIVAVSNKDCTDFSAIEYDPCVGVS